MIDRREYLAILGTGTSIGVAGCTEGLSFQENESSSPEDGASENRSGGPENGSEEDGSEGDRSEEDTNIDGEFEATYDRDVGGDDLSIIGEIRNTGTTSQRFVLETSVRVSNKQIRRTHTERSETIPIDAGNEHSLQYSMSISGLDNHETTIGGITGTLYVEQQNGDTVEIYRDEIPEKTPSDDGSQGLENSTQG